MSCITRTIPWKVGSISIFSCDNNGRVGDNAALVKTLPPGLIINFLLNYFTVVFMMYVIMGYFKLDRWTYISFASPLIMAKFILQMAIIHPFIHSQHTSWYGAHISPLIPKYIMNDYKGHVLCHHVDGYCLGDSPVYTYYYDYLLYLHGLMYKNDHIRFQSTQHYVANIALDYFLLGSVFVQLFLTVLVMYPILPGLPASERAENVSSKKKTS